VGVPALDAYATDYALFSWGGTEFKGRKTPAAPRLKPAKPAAKKIKKATKAPARSKAPARRDEVARYH